MMKCGIFVLTVMMSSALVFSESARHHVFDDFVKVEGGEMTVTADRNDFHPRGTKRTLRVNTFYIAKTEVTQELYREVTGKTPAAPYRPQNPVERVSGYDVIAFCNALSLTENLTPCYRYENGKWQCDFSADGYRVPTLDEWEFAARGGNKSRHYAYSGSDNSSEVAWYDENAGGSSRPVARLKANELGLYDMSGNVGEWNWDLDYKGECPVHIGRGGCWRYDEWFCRTSYRFVTTENFCEEGLGIRLCTSAGE